MLILNQLNYLFFGKSSSIISEADFYEKIILINASSIS